MSENDQQAQGQEAPEASSENASGAAQQGQTRQSAQTQQNASGDDGARGVMIPKARLDEESRRRREVEKELQSMRDEQEQAQEDKAQAEGNKDKLIDTLRKKNEKLDGQLKQERAERTRERRLNKWYQAAAGIVKPGKATDTAFNLLTEDDFAGIDESDAEAYKPLAQNLMEIHDYLAVDGPRGAGSGGSSQPVLNGKAMGGGREPLFHDSKRKRRPWK